MKDENYVPQGQHFKCAKASRVLPIHLVTSRHLLCADLCASPNLLAYKAPIPPLKCSLPYVNLLYAFAVSIS